MLEIFGLLNLKVIEKTHILHNQCNKLFIKTKRGTCICSMNNVTLGPFLVALYLCLLKAFCYSVYSECHVINNIYISTVIVEYKDFFTHVSIF